jgi:hypothetical protein
MKIIKEDINKYPKIFYVLGANNYDGEGIYSQD